MVLNLLLVKHPPKALILIRQNRQNQRLGRLFLGSPLLAHQLRRINGLSILVLLVPRLLHARLDQSLLFFVQVFVPFDALLRLQVIGKDGAGQVLPARDDAEAPRVHLTPDSDLGKG